jgi:flagellar biosynthetic protein FliQ
MDALDSVVRESLLVAAVLCFPVLGAATAVGTLVAVVQAATQVQEQTLTLLPKLLVVGLMAALFGGFGLRLCASLFGDALAALPAIAHGA